MIKRAMALLMVAALSGCSALSALSGLDDAPEVTAQVGAENTKQTIGVTAKQDASSKQETTIKESRVGSVDSSARKKVATASIQAETIQAEKIEIQPQKTDSYVVIFSAACFFLAGVFTGVLIAGRKKGA